MLPTSGRAAALLFTSLLLPSLAAAGDVAETLGEEYVQASPKDKCARLCVARTDKVLSLQDAQEALDEVVRGALREAGDPAAQLERLGELRGAVDAAVEAISKARREARKPYVDLIEPSDALQAAVAARFVAAKAGATPSLKTLGCLKAVREATLYTATTTLIQAFVAQALHRDEAYREADAFGRLDIIRALTVKQEMLSDLEAKDLEQAALCEWLNAQLGSEATIAAAQEAVQELFEAKRMSFFTYKWARDLLREAGALR